MAVYFIKCTVAAVIMFVAVTLCDKFFAAHFIGDGIPVRIVRLMLPFVTGVIVYALAGFILKIDLIRDTADKVLGRNRLEESK